MSVLDRRRLGVNFSSVYRAVKELTNDSEFEASNRREVAEQVLQKITSKQLPQLQQEGIDLEGIIAFIEKVLPLILMLLDLLS